MFSFQQIQINLFTE